MLSATQALSNAANTSKWAVGMCDNFVANMFGYQNSGFVTAVDHWQATPSADKHPGDMAAPAGALMFWGGGQGHVAISDGQGNIYTTDTPSPGIVSKVPADYPTTKWGKAYLGWAQPYFNGVAGAVGGGGGVQMQSPGNATAQQASVVTNLLGLFGSGTDFKDLAQRLGLIMLGSVLLLIGIWKFTGTGQKIGAAIGAGGGKRAADSEGTENPPEDGRGVRKDER